MRTLHLYGRLADTFGARWRLEVASIGEAVRAVEANRPGFMTALRAGGDYHVVRGQDLASGSGLEAGELTLEFKTGDFHICPAAAGSGLGEWLQVIGGGLIAAAGIYFRQPWLISLGLSLAAGGIVQMLTRLPQTPDDPEADKKSYLFSGPRNRTDQGGPVPLIYGGLTQPVFVGSTVISQGIQAVEASA